MQDPWDNVKALEGKTPDSKLDRVLEKLKSVFKSEKPDSLPPQKVADYEVKVKQGSKPSHTHVYQLPPAEEKAVKKVYRRFAEESENQKD